jgi:hypothetical protein
MIDLIIALLGLGVGILLALMTKEELKVGRKYFVFVRNVLFGFIELIILLFFIQQKLWLALIIISIIFILVIILEFILKSKYLRLLPFIIFISAYFLNSDTSFHFILTILIFLYSLPTGTLLYNDFKKRP